MIFVSRMSRRPSAATSSVGAQRPKRVACLQVEYTRTVQAPPLDAPPDPMGLGRDEDTISNVRQLVPKQPKPDQEKLELCALLLFPSTDLRCPVASMCWAF